MFYIIININNIKKIEFKNSKLNIIFEMIKEQYLSCLLTHTFYFFLNNYVSK